MKQLCPIVITIGLALGTCAAFAAEIPPVGQTAPEFSLPSQEGSKRTRFHYREDSIFNADSYLAFLETVGAFVPPARSHLDSRQRFVSQGRRRLGVVSNPTDTGWRYTSCRPIHRN
jgi:hypothetical protein